MADAPDEVMFQEKGVFFSNCLETIRAHQALATRFLSLEGKGSSEGGAQEFTDLGKRIDDVNAKLADQDAEFEKLHAKIDKLFPDEGETSPSQPADPTPAPAPEPTPAPEPAPSQPATPASDSTPTSGASAGTAETPAASDTPAS